MPNAAAPGVLDRYRSDAAALRYERRHRTGSRHLREARRLASVLRDVPAGARVLDLPCGAGRMFPLLASLGLRVTGADGSAAMARRARLAAAAHSLVGEVCVEDVFHTSFADGAFDAVVCNRLLHHFDEAERRAALRELARVSSGPVIVSFFCSLSVVALRARLMQPLRTHGSRRIAISHRRFERDLAAAGLAAVRAAPVSAVSQQWYVVARPRAGAGPIS